jgi:hypothetical protein
MMMFQRLLRWTIGLPVAIIVISFAVANRQWITVSLDPFSKDAPFASIDIPLWALFFCGIFFGLIAGWIACWFAQGKWRKSAKDARRELVRTQSDASQMRRELVTTPDSML